MSVQDFTEAPLFRHTDRRFRLLHMSMDLLFDLAFSHVPQLVGGGEDQKVRVVEVEGIPKDARIEGISLHESFHKNEVTARVWSSEFAVLEENSGIPELEVTVKDKLLPVKDYVHDWYFAGYNSLNDEYGRIFRALGLETVCMYEEDWREQLARNNEKLSQLKEKGIKSFADESLRRENSRLQSLLAEHHNITNIRKAYEQVTGDCQICKEGWTFQTPDKTALMLTGPAEAVTGLDKAQPEPSQEDIARVEKESLPANLEDIPPTSKDDPFY